MMELLIKKNLITTQTLKKHKKKGLTRVNLNESIVGVGIESEDFVCDVATINHAGVRSDRVDRAPNWHVGLHRK